MQHPDRFPVFLSAGGRQKEWWRRTSMALKNQQTRQLLEAGSVLESRREHGGGRQ